MFKITQLLAYLTTIDELRARCHAERRWSIFDAKLTAWRPKIFHIFHFLQSDMVCEIASPLCAYLMQLICRMQGGADQKERAYEDENVFLQAVG